jgi:HD-like signal output (HDOD) protein
LVHDIGRLVLALAVPDRFAALVAHERDTGREDVAHERACIGVSHAEVGGYLLGVWGLPLSIVEAVVHHHEPGLFGGVDRESLALVHVACAFTAAGGPDTDDGLDLAFLERAGFEGRLAQLRAVARTLAGEECK